MVKILHEQMLENSRRGQSMCTGGKVHDLRIENWVGLQQHPLNNQLNSNQETRRLQAFLEIIHIGS